MCCFTDAIFFNVLSCLFSLGCRFIDPFTVFSNVFPFVLITFHLLGTVKRRLMRRLAAMSHGDNSVPQFFAAAQVRLDIHTIKSY